MTKELKFNRPGLAWVWMMALLVALATASAHKGFWGAHGESRRAEVAREVLQDGHWLVPTLLGEAFITKPPLLYWSSAASMALLGIHDWASRVPAIVATLLSWLALLSLGRSYLRELRLAGIVRDGDESPRLGLLAGSALLSMPLVLMMGLNTETEPLLLACTAGSVAAWLRLPARGERASWLSLALPGLALALGFMVKGPLGWLFPFFGVLALELGLPVSRRRANAWRILLILALQVLVALPWFLLVLRELPGAMQIWLGESVARVSDADFQVHREPWWYYLPRLAVFLPPLLWLRRDLLRHPLTRAPLLWLGLGVLFLSLAGSKRTHYLLSLSPAAALIPLAAIKMKLPRLENGLRLAGAGLLLVVPVATAYLLAQDLLIPSIWIGLGLVLALAGSWWLGVSKQLNGHEALAAALLLLLVGGSPGILKAVDAYRNPRPFYEECAKLTKGSRMVVNWRNDRYSASFYMQAAIPYSRNDEELRGLTPDPVWLISLEKDLERLSRPYRVVARQEFRDPFQPSHVRIWTLVLAEADSMRTGK